MSRTPLASTATTFGRVSLISGSILWACRISKKNWTLRPQQQKAGETLVIGVFRRLGAEYVGSGLAPQNIDWRIGYLVCQCDERNYDGDNDSLQGADEHDACERHDRP